MITELAIGAEPEAVLFARYGIGPADAVALQNQTWFTRAINERRDEMAAEGFTFAAKMGVLAEDLLVQVYHEAKTSDSLSLKLDVAKYLTKIANLEPKQNTPAQLTGSGFSITIHLGEGPQQEAVPGITIDGQTLPPAQADPWEMIEALPSTPEYITQSETA